MKYMRERREDRRKSFKLIGLGLIAIIIFGGLFFPEVPNINTYIGTKDAHDLTVTKVENHDAKRNNHPEAIVISEGKGNSDQVHAYASKNGVTQFHQAKAELRDRKFIYVELKTENDPHDFAQSIDNAAIYIAQLMHKYHLNPNAKAPTLLTSDGVSKKSDTDIDDYFEKYGYSTGQFFSLIRQYYDGDLIKPPFALKVAEKIIAALKVIAIIIGIMMIVSGLVLPKKRWLSWWDV